MRTYRRSLAIGWLPTGRTKTNRDAYGTKVLVYAGNRKLLREISGGSSHASQNSSIAHIGLGGLVKVDSVQILWLGAKTETIILPVINQVHKIKQAEKRANINTGGNGTGKTGLKYHITPLPVK
ncbi:MAG: ASPIC/UnbV domain-containing protein [Lewinellaceae bacterium]|nr:ASPIC/UnbV domain-containing protein [Lewinellaceae bacterium]